MFVLGHTNISKTICILIKKPQSGEGQNITYLITQINYSYFTDNLITTSKLDFFEPYIKAKLIRIEAKSV